LCLFEKKYGRNEKTGSVSVPIEIAYGCTAKAVLSSVGSSCYSSAKSSGQIFNRI
jgi:hypothetical protein